MQHLIPEPKAEKHVYIAALGEEAQAEGVKIQFALREDGVITDMDLQGRTSKAR